MVDVYLQSILPCYKKLRIFEALYIEEELYQISIYYLYKQYSSRALIGWFESD